jgi:hypothetical protein
VLLCVNMYFRGLKAGDRAALLTIARQQVRVKPTPATLVTLGHHLNEADYRTEAVDAVRQALRTPDDLNWQQHLMAAVVFADGGRYQECLDQIAVCRKWKPKPAADRGEKAGSGERDEVEKRLDRMGKDVADLLEDLRVEGTPQLDLIEEHVRERMRLQPKLQDLLAGRRTPASLEDDEDLVPLADSATSQGHTLVAARLWAVARDDAILWWLAPSELWQSAAGSTAAAGCDPATPDAERAKFRGLALTMVREQVTTHRKQLKAKKAGDRSEAAKSLGTLLVSADLAGVREETELANLPADEQKEWRAAWAEVRKLLAEVVKPASVPDRIPHLVW